LNYFEENIVYRQYRRQDHNIKASMNSDVPGMESVIGTISSVLTAVTVNKNNPIEFFVINFLVRKSC